ncbi:MAG: prolipoprotein diacylglyceryl transferase [Acidobacteriia bacterium]|nr:prolipoprotein diacylglyceryl transferase [Terriglobia bacterium]
MFPILLKIGSLTLPTYGFLLAAGYLVGLFTAIHFAKKEGLDPNSMLDLGLLVALAALLGAKLFLIFQDFRFYISNPREIFTLAFLHSGGIFYGGFLIALAAGLWYCRRKHFKILKVMDAFAPGIILGHAIGRLGCFSAGCCWGLPTRVPWAVTFTNPFSHDIVGVPLDIPLHPTQLYEAAANFCIFLFLRWRYPHKKFDGEMFSMYLMCYAAWRFFVEFFRAHDPEALMWGGALSTAQFISVLCLLVGVWLYYSQRRKGQVGSHV